MASSDDDIGGQTVEDVAGVSCRDECGVSLSGGQSRNIAGRLLCRECASHGGKKGSEGRAPESESKLSPPRFLQSIFNPMMLLGAVLGGVIWLGFTTIQETWRHEGPGVVWYEQPERGVEVPEAQYKRHAYTNGGLLLVIGIAGWILAARWDARRKK